MIVYKMAMVLSYYVKCAIFAKYNAGVLFSGDWRCHLESGIFYEA